METREERGKAIALAGRLRQKGHLWIVPSQARAGTYVVEPDDHAPSCTCPDFEERGQPCKHIFAVEYTLRRETNADGETTVTEQLRLTFRQDWPSYNAAQVQEKERVAALLHDLCSVIDNPVHVNGRPRLPLADTTFAAVMKVYGGASSRRTQTDLREFAAKGYIEKAPHFNSVLNALEDPALTSILQGLIAESARPLRSVETDYAVDSSGFSTSVYSRWFSEKYGREKSMAQWVKAHVMIGTATNVVTSIEVTDARIADTSVFMDLVDDTATRFSLKRVSADKAYSSKLNLMTVADAGAVPYIAFKKNARSWGMDLWGRTLDLFLNHREEFLTHYHKRSNVETTFHMIKAKFGGRLRSKTPVAQRNEVLCKVLCHNLCCLVSAFYELGITATFWQKSA